jgi:hypothetical protein
VNNTAGKALGKPQEALGGLLKNKGGGKEDEEGGEDPGENEQLRLRLDINLDIEVQLKAKIHGDLTLGLLYVYPSPCEATANPSQKLGVDDALHPLVSTIPVLTDREQLMTGANWSCFRDRVPVLMLSMHFRLYRRPSVVSVCNKMINDQNRLLTVKSTHCLI